jgi:hypothetical protein
MTAGRNGLAVLFGVLAATTFAAAHGQTAAATGSAIRLSRSCVRAFVRRAFAPTPLPQELSTPLEASIVSSFAIFRRPALPSDAPPGSKLAGGELRRQLHQNYELARYYPAYVRELATFPNGRRYFVVPAFALPEAALPARCLSTQARRKLAERQHARSVEPVFCIIETGAPGSAPPQGCEPFAEIDEGVRAFEVSDLDGEHLSEPTIELVPDGVTSVRVTYESVPPLVLPVSENAFALTPPKAPNSPVDAELRRLLQTLTDQHVAETRRLKALRRWDEIFRRTRPARIEWLNAGGEVVRTLERPAVYGGSTTFLGSLDAPIGSGGVVQVPARRRARAGSTSSVGSLDTPIEG